jgi:uncharacterized protein with PIN domain
MVIDTAVIVATIADESDSTAYREAIKTVPLALRRHSAN